VLLSFETGDVGAYSLSHGDHSGDAGGWLGGSGSAFVRTVDFQGLAPGFAALAAGLAGCRCHGRGLLAVLVFGAFFPA
jgi:hypothetical protein